MVKALFFDLDGTLLTSAKKMSEKTKSALSLCRDKGVKVFVATARPPLLGKMLCLTPEEEVIIKDGGVFYNGGCICCNSQKFYTTIPLEAVKLSIEIINSYRDINYALQMEHEKHCFRYAISDAEYASWGVDKEELLYYNELKYLDTIKIVVFSPWDRLPSLQLELIDAVGELANVYLTGRNDFKSIEIVSKTIDKKLAVDRIASLCRFNKHEVAVFGDDYNDIEMLKGFDYSVAMGNACDEVKSHARFVTLGNDEEGIYHALRNILKII